MAAVFCVKRPLGGVRRDDADRDEERQESEMEKKRRFHNDEEQRMRRAFRTFPVQRGYIR